MDSLNTTGGFGPHPNGGMKMNIIKTLIIKERKNDWAIQVKVEGARSQAFGGVETIATFRKRPMGLIMAGKSFNSLLEWGGFDHKMIHASAEGLQSLYAVGIEPIPVDA